MNTLPHFKRIAMVARWKPVHLGHVPVLRALCSCADRAFIGIGSSNRYNARNPFTLEETMEMLQLVLASHSNYTLVPVPDLDDGPRWRLMVLGMFGSLDAFVTDNPYVASLLRDDYLLLRPVALLPPEERIAVDGNMVRRELARGGNWRALVSPEIADYIAARHLDERFRREFGLETLALDAVVS